MSGLASFNESINWEPLPGPDGLPADHIGMSILNIDDRANIVDVLQIRRWRQNRYAQTHIGVQYLRRERRTPHLLPDGELTEARPAGTYRCGQPSEEPHTEGGGSECRNPL